ncbi:benzil reductase ((S)-benzoin forming) [Paenibacillus sp. UNC496MF]|uniref:SDR family NAD(P)-dependent oxidoreductase n=1 Tax=Paenibacillus sp. UNC496MF TaxID=1502753 RepID=UPI0008F13512|nr:SDR family NAD(P)-dependent oxidoreductase [Paenibacillus sp. UNC496MF]SFI51171.1 benzil reductase ((S)-benzoin forming) [Paenibacillus sp. UNC496MF]
MANETKVAIVTGASRGIGEALAATLHEKGYSVIGIARSTSGILSGLERFTPVSFDLSDAGKVEAMADRLFAEVAALAPEELLLVNNAAMLEPIRPIEAIRVPEMTAHIQTSLIAPMALCGAFVRHAQPLPIVKRIVNVTSGLAVHSAPWMSLYCSAKAALNMLTRCIADEQAGRPHPILAYALDPGMTDTRMQADARERSEADFPLQPFFRERFEQGGLWPPARVAAEAIRLLGYNHPNGSLLRVHEPAQSAPPAFIFRSRTGPIVNRQGPT